MNIPTIGGTRGIFEIFVPGVFLLLNIGGVLYLSPFIDQNTKDLLLSASSSPVLGLVIAICFGYLIGILLRLLPVDLADNLSAGWLRRFSRAATKGKKHETLFASEAFPYIEYMEETSRHVLCLDLRHRADPGCDCQQLCHGTNPERSDLHSRGLFSCDP